MHPFILLDGYERFLLVFLIRKVLKQALIVYFFFFTVLPQILEFKQPIQLHLPNSWDVGRLVLPVRNISKSLSANAEYSN